MKQTVYPVRVVKSEGFTDTSELLKRKDLQIGLNEKSVSKCEGAGYVILDFGKEMNGGIRILTFLSNGSNVRFRFGESLTETCSEVGKSGATNDHAVRDFSIDIPDYSDQTFGETGFRYLRIDVKGKIEIKSVVSINNLFRGKPLYEYKGEDQRIKDIYNVAKRTIDLCVGGSYVWDGVKRDRLVWVGDMHPEMLALSTLYGRVKKFEKSLDFAKKQAPIPCWMNNSYPSYSLWWIIIIADYFEYTKAYDFTKKQIPYLKKLTKMIDGYVKENGELDYPAYFVDWQTCEKVDEKTGVRAINVIAMKKAIKLLEAFNENSEFAESILERLNKVKITVKESKSVAALKYFAVGLDEEDKKLLIKNGAEGLSTFMGYYILEAIASFDKDKAVSVMKEYYGGMLDKGATTFWEDFSLSWTENSCDINSFPKKGEKDIHGDFGDYCYVGFRHSLCHGWSSGVIKFIKEYC